MEKAPAGSGRDDGFREARPRIYPLAQRRPGQDTTHTRRRSAALKEEEYSRRCSGQVEGGCIIARADQQLPSHSHPDSDALARQ
jgi:hypothetical protein